MITVTTQPGMLNSPRESGSRESGDVVHEGGGRAPRLRARLAGGAEGPGVGFQDFREHILEIFQGKGCARGSPRENAFG